MAEWDYITDFLVVGSGGGLVGAVAASVAGLEPLVIEKTEYIGGSTGMSGGVLWLPDNPLMQREGVPDSLEQALQYFAAVVGDAGPASSDARRRAYIIEGARMVEALEQEGMTFVRCEGYSDYYAEVAGIPGGSVRGRAIECVPTDTKRIGPLAEQLRPSIAAPMVLLTGEAAKMSLLRSRTGIKLASRVVGRMALNKLRNQRLTTNGAALITQLLEVLLRRQVPIWTEAPFVDLIQDDGRVVGAIVRRHGHDVRVLARRGVLISAGGFAQSPELRRKYGGEQPNEAKWSHANPGDTGEVMQNIIDHGAASDMLDEAWWNPTILGPNGAKHMVIPERTRPHSIMVDQSGRRFFNEAVSYMEAGRRMYERQRETGGGVPSWLIIDSQHRSRYLLGPMPPGRTNKEWITSGYLKRADSLADLAQECGIDAGTLTATVERFNRFAESGIDEDFHRGEGAHDRYQGDPSNLPNPCLGPVTKPPFYAIEVYPGDVGTCGGLLCNEYSQVLSVDGDVIPGLYAAGNVSASVMGRTYPGAGASIGASTVFSFIAGNHAASGSGSSAQQAAVPAGGLAEAPNKW